MNILRHLVRFAVAVCVVSFAYNNAPAQDGKKPYEPVPGQPGKDSVWVPTPLSTLETMFDLAKLTPQDFVMDLGSGDGRAIIAAGKRGTPGLGVEWNDDLIALSNKMAAQAGVSHLAKFTKGDMFAADISKASVMALFMLPDQFSKLIPKFLAMRPGSRIVVNGFAIPGWPIDETTKSTGECGSWCTAHLYIVPANVAGTWRLANGSLTLKQSFQVLSGEISAGGKSMPISNGRMRGDQIRFSIGEAQYTGGATDSTMSGEMTGGSTGAWSATKQ